MSEVPVGTDQIPAVVTMVFLTALAAGLGTRLSRHLATDFTLIVEWLARAVAVLATLRLPRSHRARWRQEWLAEVEAVRKSTDVAPTFALLLYAIPLLLRAGKQARELRAAPVAVRRTASHQLYVSLARGNARTRTRFRARLGLIGLIAALVGVPGANLGWNLISADLGSGRAPQQLQGGGVEDSEIIRHLMRERSAFRATQR